MYIRNLPEPVARKIKILAAERRATLADVVTAALESLTAVHEQASESEEQDLFSSLREEKDWYQQNRERLLQQYEGHYVAIVGRQVIDHDPSFHALAQRVFTKLRNRPVFMPKVDRDRSRPALRSPRVVRP
ncbi:MAG: hypothetical protein IRY95_07060 [Clostridia bacterium]|nr:hypothetical protein [Clostridia bacterium]